MRLYIPLQLTFIGIALLLGACMTGNDKNNATGNIDPAVMGQTLVNTLGATQNWHQIVASPKNETPLPTSAPTKSSASLGSLSKRAALAKSGPNDTVWTVDSISKPGVAIVIVTMKKQPTLLQTTIDTIEIVFDDKAHDTIKDNETVIRLSHSVYGTLGTLERVEVKDADGDNRISYVPGTTNKAQALFTHSMGSTVEFASIIVGPGPDGIYDSTGEADNLVYEATWTKSINGKLKASATFSDDDADGIIVNNASISKVRLDLVEIRPDGKPTVDSAHATIRVKNLGFGKGDEPVGLHYIEYLLNDQVNEVSFKNSKGTEDFIANDTMHAIFESRIQNTFDTLISAKLDFLFNPGANLKSDSDDVFYAMYAETHKRLGFERDVEFHFISATPIPHGQNATAGSIFVKVTYANGKTATIKGTFSPKGYTTTYTGPDGKTFTVIYDKNGKPL